MTRFVLNQNLSSDNGICGKPFIKLVAIPLLSPSIDMKMGDFSVWRLNDYIPGGNYNQLLCWATVNFS